MKPVRHPAPRDAESAGWCTVIVLAVAMCATAGAQAPAVDTPDVAACEPAQSASVMWSCRIPSQGNMIHGLSGLFYDRATASLWAASDDTRSYPGDPARVLRFDLTARIALSATVSLRRETTGGGAVPLWQLEAMAPVLDKGAWTGSFFMATENDELSPRFSSAIYRCTSSGSCRQELDLPAESATPQPRASSGIQNNKGIEGLTISPDGTRLFAAFESALAQEAPANGPGRARVLEYALDGGRAPVRQYAYAVDPAPKNVDQVRGAPGISEILALSATELLVLERSFTAGCGNTIRLFKATLDPARALRAGDDVRNLPGDKILKKELLIDLATEARAFADRRLARYLENFEGMTFGPELPDRTPTLLMVSDDNRGGDQINSLVRLRMSSLPTASARMWKEGDPPVFAAECN